MIADLKRRAISGLGWTAGLRLGTQLAQFGTIATLARLLRPSDFGLVGMTTVFTAFLEMFMDLGFGAALMQKQEVEDRHYTSIFWLSTGMGVLLTALVFFAAPVIALFYHEPRLVEVARIMALAFIASASSAVPATILRRKMEFRRIALIESMAVISGPVCAIGLAATGLGVLSLAWSPPISAMVGAIAMWWSTRWRPRVRLDWSALSDLSKFSRNLVGYNLFDYWVTNTDNMLVGKYIGPEGLGIYSKAYSTMLLPLTQVSRILGSVVFPVLCRIQYEKQRVKGIYLRSISLIALVTFPMMLGLLVVARSFVVAVFGVKWIAMTTVIQILCPVGLVQSIGTTVGWIYHSQGRTDWLFRWGLVAGVFLIGSIIVGVRIGSIQAVAVCYAVMSGVVLIYPSFAIPGRLIGMTFHEVVSAVAGILALSSLMAGAVWMVGAMLPPEWPAWACLSLQVPFGFGIYWLLVHAFKVKAYREAKQLVHEHLQTAFGRAV